MIDFHLPQLGEGVYEAELVEWLVAEGETVQPGQSLAEVMTDKATMELPARFTGVIDSLLVEPGSLIKINDVILTYNEARPEDSSNSERQKESVGAAPTNTNRRASTKNSNTTPQESVAAPVSQRVPAAPAVRVMAQELGVDLKHVEATGPHGRVLLADLAKWATAQETSSTGAFASPKRLPAREATGEPDFGTPGERRAYQGLRRTIGQRMVAAKHAIPHYSYVDECDFTTLVGLRNALKDALADEGVKLTYLAFVVKAAALALKEVPLVNSTLDEQAGQILIHEEYNVGIAVAARDGLIVPVLRGADRKSVGQIAREIEELSRLARSGKIQRDQLHHGTFTVTSVGGIGGLISTPIINAPQAAIMGVGKVVRRPVYDEQGALRPADIVFLSFTFDHRIIDGAVGAVFGNAVIRRLERPQQLLLD